MSHGGGNEANAQQIVWFKKHFCHILLCVRCDVSSNWMRRRWRYFNAAATPASSRYRHGLPARLDGDVCVQPNDPSHGRSCASYLGNKLGKPASQLDPNSSTYSVTISGTPDMVQTATFTIQAMDSKSRTATQSYIVNIKKLVSAQLQEVQGQVPAGSVEIQGV